MTRAARSRLIAALTVALAGPLVCLTPVARARDVCPPTDAACAVEALSSDPAASAEEAAGAVSGAPDQVGDGPGRIVAVVVDAALGNGPVVDPPGSGHVPGRRPDPSGSTSHGSGGGGPTATIRESVVPPRTVISAASGSRPLPPHGSPGRSDGLIQETVRSLVLLLVLLGFAVGFVLLQDRVDRNDSKLRAAPARADIITFG
jgi:hypothetical protein